MPLRIVAGLPGSGASEFLLDLAARESASGQVVIFAVPEDSDAESARSLMAARAPVGPRIATFDGIVEAEWALRGDGRRLVRGLGRDVLLARALRECGVSSEPRAGLISLLRTLAERADAMLPGSGAGSDLAGDLVRAVGSFRRFALAAGMVERSEVCRRLGESTPPADVIVVDGFRSLDGPQETLLSAWAAAGAMVVVSLAWLPGTAGTEAVSPLVSRLEEAGATIQILPNCDGDLPPELLRARSGLFAGPVPTPGTGAVQLIIAEGLEAEARAIARAVATALDDGVQPDEVVVAFSDPSRHEAWLRRAFRDEGVPARFSTPMPVGETPIGSALLTLRACALADIPRAELSALMRGPFGGVRGDEADEADLAWRKSGATGGAALLRRAGAARRLVDDVRPLAGAAIDTVTADKWKKMADRLLANANPGASPVPGMEATLDAAVHRAFCRSLQEALDLGGPGVGADEFWERFAQVRVTPPFDRTASSVRVTGLDGVTGDNIAHVVIGGLTASECPRRGSEDRLEGDAVSRAMRMMGIVSEPDEHLREERRAFFLAVATARRSLTLTRRVTDEEGSPLRESVFWDEFLDLYRPPGAALSDDAEPRLVHAAAQGGRVSGSRRSVRGRLDSAVAAAALSEIAEVSPSEVETYVSCPYRWFIERRLRASSPDAEIDPAAVGRIAHDALARFYDARLARGDGRVRPEEREQASAEAGRFAIEQVSALTGAERLEGLALLQSVPPAVAALVARDAEFLPGYEPVRVEWSFGGRSDSPAVDLGGVALKGRADRIDVGPEGLVVVDYKRTVASSLSEIRSKGLVQLQLYAAAASRDLGLPVAGGLYRGLRDGSDRGFVRREVSERGRFYSADIVSASELTDLLDQAVSTAVRAAADMRSGRIEPTPSATACRYCAAAYFCPQAVTS